MGRCLHTKKEFFWDHQVRLTPLGRTSFLPKRHPNIFHQQADPAEEIQVSQGTKPTEPFPSFSMRLWLSSPIPRHLGILAKLEMRHSHNKQPGLGIIIVFTGSRLLGFQTLGKGKDTGLGSHHTLLHQEKQRLGQGKPLLPSQAGSISREQCNSHDIQKRKKQKQKQNLSRAESQHCTEKILKIKLHLNKMD